LNVDFLKLDLIKKSIEDMNKLTLDSYTMRT